MAEMLVAMVMMLTVMLALYATFDMSMRVFGFGSDKLEAVEGARLGLQRMEREIRAAYPYDDAEPVATEDVLFETWAPDEIAFGNDLDGDREIGPSEIIGYYRNEEGALIRRKGGSRRSVAAYVAAGGLRFTYCGSADDCPPSVPVTDEGEIGLVRITLTVAVDKGTQTLTTAVDLRNR